MRSSTPELSVGLRSTIEIDRFPISSDNSSMQLLVKLAISSAMAIHAVLGCCAHHEHCAVAEHKVVEAQRPCHGHDHHSCGSEKQSGVPQDCDEENCVFVASKHNDFHMIDWAGLSSLTVISELLDLGEQRSNYSRIAPEDVPYLVGPALHVWQCVWVI